MQQISSSARLDVVGLRRPEHRRRRGAATLWLILFLPVLLIVLCIVMEVGMLWLSRVELEDSLESAALSGLTYWNPSTQNAASARSTAISFGQSNSVLGTPLTLVDANILLGTVPSNTNGPFSAGTTPNCVTPIQSIDIDISVETAGGGGGGAGTTFNDPNSFLVEFTGIAPAGFSITKLTIFLQNPSPDWGTDDGVFHPNNGGPVTEANGYGPVFSAGGTFVGSPSSVAYSGGNSTMTMTFPFGVWTVGKQLRFGIDTDLVGIPNGPDIDRGGEFGINYPGNERDTTGRISWTFELTNLSGSQTAVFPYPLKRQGPNKSQNIGNTPPPPAPPVADAAVRAEATWTIPSRCIPGFNYTISAKSTAVSRCADPTFVLIHSP